MYNENILSLGIISIIIVALIVLCVTGYSFKNVRNAQQEHFFSSIKKWINGGEEDNVKPYNTPLSMASTQLSPEKEKDVPVSPTINHNLNNVIDTTHILKNKVPPRNVSLSSNNIATMGLKKAGHVALDNTHTKDVKMNLQFFDSTDTPDEDEFIYTGAEIGLTGANISCGNSKVKSVKAEGIAILDKDGSISDIKMVEKGKGYNTPPKVIISGGGGSGCKAKAIVDDNMSIAHIEIINGGSGYISTPKIIIESPNYNKKCRLYLKK